MDQVAPKLLTVEDAAERLQLPARELKKAIESGSLAHVRLGKHTRIHPADLDDYCRRHTVRAWSPAAAA